MSFTYVFFVTLSFGFDYVRSSQVNNKSANAIFQKVDFVEIVKEDLRRNNEDYGEIKYDNKLTSATEEYYGITKKSTLSIKVNDILKSNRRTNVESTETSNDGKGISSTTESLLIKNGTTKINPIHELLRSQTKKKIVKEKLPTKLSKIDIIRSLMTRTVKPTTNVTQSLQIKNAKIPKLVHKSKIDKFKKFMSKNKGLLKGFLSSKIEIQSPKKTSKDPLRTEYPISSDEEPRGIINEINKIKISDDDKIDLISPDLLDMAPAKGGRIHRQRIKGRLCQRHVLMPEGPKYDSQGKWYLPAHNLLVRHPYNVTFPPKLILPRCCNCCKKSVLGCE